MKSIKFFLIGLCFALASLTAVQPAQAQTPNSTFLSTANKVVYSTNAIEIQDSIKKTSYSLKKGTIIVQNVGTGTGAYVKIIEAHSLRPVWGGLVAGLRIVGVANSDSLKVVSLKTVPY